MSTGTFQKIPEISFYLFQFWIRIPMEFLPAVGLWKALPVRKPWYSGMLPGLLKKDLHCCIIWSAAAQYGAKSCLVADRKENFFPMISLLAGNPMFAVSKQAGCNLDFHILSFFFTQNFKISHRVKRWEIKETVEHRDSPATPCVCLHICEKIAHKALLKVLLT